MDKLRKLTEQLDELLDRIKNDSEYPASQAIIDLQALFTEIQALISKTKLAYVIHLSKLLSEEIESEIDKVSSRLLQQVPEPEQEECPPSYEEFVQTYKQKTAPDNKQVVIYTDGACSGNPGPGGWCAILQCGNKEKVISGGDEHTTNNRMELISVIEALRCLRVSCNVNIYSDSKYVTDAFNKGWIEKWKNDDWMNCGTPRTNYDLWKILYDLVAYHTVTFNWVKGHNGDSMNERCDRIAEMIAQGKNVS